MAERSRAHRFLENTGWSLLKQGVTLAFSFFLTPVLVHGLGTEGYALYSLIGVVLGYFSTMSLGAGAASIRFLSEAAAVHDTTRLRSVFHWSLVFHLTLPLLAGIALAFGAPHASAWFSVAPEQTETFTFLLRCVAVGGVLFMLAQAGANALLALDRFGKSSLIEMSLALVLLGGSALLVHLGLGLREIGILFLIANVLYAAVNLALSWDALKSRLARPGPTHHPISFKDFTAYTLPLFAGQLIWVLNFQTDKVFIATLLPISALTYYVIPSSIIQRLETLPRSVSFAAFQMASELHGLNRPESLKRLYLKGTKLLWLMLTPVLVLLFAFAPQFLTLWLGPEFSDHGTWPLRLLIAAFSCYFLGQLPMYMALGMGRPYYSAVTLGVGVAISFILWPVFIPRYGIIAAAACFGVAQAVAAAGTLVHFHAKVVPVKWGDYIHQSLLPPLGAGVVLMVLALLLHPRADTWPRLISSVSAGTLVFYGIALAFLDAEEKDLLRQFINRRRE